MTLVFKGTYSPVAALMKGQGDNAPVISPAPRHP